MCVTPTTDLASASDCLKEAARLHPELLQYARSLTGGHDDAAQDLVQEALLRLHDGARHRGLALHLVRWRVLAIIKNVHVDEHRRNVKFRQLEQGGGEEGDTYEHPGALAYGQQLQREAEASHRTQQLGALAAAELAAVFGLADRIYFRLSAEGFSARIISQMTGGSSRTISRSILAIRAHLRAYLTPLLATA